MEGYLRDKNYQNFFSKNLPDSIKALLAGAFLF